MDNNVPMSFTEHKEIEGLYIVTPHLFKDFRGEYKKIYEREQYAANGILPVFSETSEITSDKGVFRGLHFQTKDSQAKLVHVIKGKIFDVAVDLRPNSKTFGQWASFMLTDTENMAVYIPEDFAHGFLALEDQTIFTYQCSGVYRAEYCGGICWDDPELNIPWPLDGIDGVILSEKDKHNMTIAQYKEKMNIKITK